MCSARVGVLCRSTQRAVLVNAACRVGQRTVLCRATHRAVLDRCVCAVRYLGALHMTDGEKKKVLPLACS